MGYHLLIKMRLQNIWVGISSSVKDLRHLKFMTVDGLKYTFRPTLQETNANFNPKVSSSHYATRLSRSQLKFRIYMSTDS